MPRIETQTLHLNDCELRDLLCSLYIDPVRHFKDIVIDWTCNREQNNSKNT
jgi:hypothetical protein